MTPLTYVVKSGAATLAEISQLARTDKATTETLKQWAIDEMKELGITPTVAA